MADDRDTVGRPNIVWIVCHDISAPLLGAYGHSLARTPIIDRLAEQGIRYDNAFAVAPVCAPSRFSLVTGLYPESCGPAQHMRAVGHVPPAFASLPELMRAGGYYATNNVFTDYNCDLDPGRIWDGWSATAHWRDRPAGAPFFCVYNYLTAHESRVIGFRGDPVTDPAAVAVPPYLPDRPEIRAAIAANVDVVNRQDAALATLLAQLEEDGLAESTIVVFLADHGGVAPRSKRYCYEEGLRVPLIVRVPDAFAALRYGNRPGVPTRQVVSLIDLAPTTLALAGLDIPEQMAGVPFLGRPARSRPVAFSGRNRMDERYDMVRTARDERFRYIRNYAPHRICGQHNAYEWQLAGYQVWEQAHLDGVLNAAQDRFWREKPAEELYDIDEDPHELVNLAADSAHAARLTALSDALDAHMIAVNDNGFIPEGGEVEGYGPSRAPGAFPIGETLAVARAAIERTPANAPALLAALEHESVVVRFWAAQGLLMMRGAEALAEPLRARLAVEPSPQVLCVLAEALGKAGDPVAAVAALAGILEASPSPRVALQALDALTHLPPDAARAARASIAAVADADEYTRNAASYLRLRLDGDYTPASRTLIATMPTDPAVLRQLSDPRI